MRMETDLNSYIVSYINSKTKAAPLVVFRILFGLVMCFSMIRFWLNGWIEELYINPSFLFKYDGFEWVQVLGNGTYLLFFICGLSALFVAIGFKYRIAITVFFLSFLYIELLDKTNYLNHYYFISVVSFILIWLPAHCNSSIDSSRNPIIKASYISRWQIDILKLMLAIVYIYAGLAKLNYDWIIRAMPLTIWLPTKVHIPIIGALLDQKWMHYAFSWGGAIYDLSIVFFLLWKRTRGAAFMLVIMFHVLTAVLFPIGMFPYIMIFSTLIFFSSSLHANVLQSISRALPSALVYIDNGKSYMSKNNKLFLIFLGVFMMFQVALPLRYLTHDGNVFWHERGYRYAWRVMLMEKTGYANFRIVDTVSQKRFYVRNDDFLTARQEKEMATQPDFILQYAKYLGKHFSSQGHKNLAVYVESYVSLNGRKSQPFVNPEVNLINVDYTTLCNNFLIPLDE